MLSWLLRGQQKAISAFSAIRSPLPLAARLGASSGIKFQQQARRQAPLRLVVLSLSSCSPLCRVVVSAECELAHAGAERVAEGRTLGEREDDPPVGLFAVGELRLYVDPEPLVWRGHAVDVQDCPNTLPNQGFLYPCRD